MRRPVAIALVANDPDGDGLTFRIVEQGRHGNVGLAGATARYIPEAGFSGTDAFTFTASDGSTDGPLATVTVTVSGAACDGDCDGDGRVAIHELVNGVRIALGSSPLVTCSACDANGDGAVSVDELVRAVNAALGACPA